MSLQFDISEKERHLRDKASIIQQEIMRKTHGTIFIELEWLSELVSYSHDKNVLFTYNRVLLSERALLDSQTFSDTATDPECKIVNIGKLKERLNKRYVIDEKLNIVNTLLLEVE